MKKVLSLLIFCWLFSSSFGQNFDSMSSLNIMQLDTHIANIEAPPGTPKKKSFFEIAWRPAAFALISVDLLRDSTKYGLQKLARSFVSDTFYTHVDDWIHYAPIVTMYTADLFKVPAKNTVWNQTKFLIMSELITSGIVLSLKYGLGIQRPNNGAYNAYPSGHTSQAFVQSQVLFNEFRETSPLLAASGFLFSTTTGALRVLKNKHWVPDVLLGAGLGMFVTNAIYYFEPLKNWDPFKKMRAKNDNVKLNFVPSIRNDYVGGFMRLQF